MRRYITASCIMSLLAAGCDLTLPWSESLAEGRDPTPESTLSYNPESLEFTAVIGDPAPAPQKIYVTSGRAILAQAFVEGPPISSITPEAGGFVVRVVEPEVVGVGNWFGSIALIPCEHRSECLSVNARSVGVRYIVGPGPLPSR